MRTQRSVLVAVGLVAISSCGGGSDGVDIALPPLLSVDDLGPGGWVASDPGEVALTPGAVAPPCPFTGDIPEVKVAAADSIEFGDVERGLGINHTVVELRGEADTAQAVLDTWATMDCTGSDADQRPVDGLPADVFGIELDTVDDPFTQAILVRVEGSTMSFLVVTGDGDTPIDVARRLAPLI